MVLCTCLHIKKNAVLSMNHSYGFCQRITSSSPLSPRYTRFYSNSTAPSLLFRQPSLSLPPTRLPSSNTFNASSQYPSLLHKRSSSPWRFMSAKAMPYGNNDLDFQYETNDNDMTPIERLTSTTTQLHQNRLERSSLPSATDPSTTTFDTTALRSHVDDGRLDDALSLVLCSRTANGRLLDYPAKDRRLLCTRLSSLPATELVCLLEPWIQQQRNMQQQDNSTKRLIQLLKYLGSNLPTDLVQALLHHFPSDYCIQSALFGRFVKDYINSISDVDGEARLDDILDYLDPVSSNYPKKLLDIKTRLYNMALNGCLKKNQWNHVDKVLARMESSGCSLDAVSFNMLIRSRLDQGDVDAASALYHQLTQLQVTPTTATFNTFIKYACEQQLWDMLGLWLDRLTEQGQQHRPNRVTLRILVAALTDYIDQPAVVEAFERVASMVPVMDAELETNINTCIVHLLRQKQTDTALGVLNMLFNRLTSLKHHQLSIYSYNILIHALAQKGDMEAADQVLASMRDHHHELGKDVGTKPAPDIVSYTTLIHGYIRSTNSHDMNVWRILALYQELMDSGLETNATLQAVILYGMVKSGFQDIEEYAPLFESMVNEENPGEHTHQQQRRHQQSFWDIDSKYGDQRQQSMNPKVSRMTMYNIMMDGYFLRNHYRGHSSLLSSSTAAASSTEATASSVTFTSSSPTSSSPSSSTPSTQTPSGFITAVNGRDQHIPPESLALLNRAIEKGLPLTTATLNIWVRGLAVFNHDLPAAESMVKWMALTHGVEMNERTVYYLVRTAIRQDRRDKARKWIALYENTGQTIQGAGLQYFKNMITK